MRAVAIGMSVGLSCGGSQHPQPVEEVAGTVKTYQPLGIKSDAKMPNRAGDPRDRTITTARRCWPLPAVATKANVDALWVKMGTAGGGFTPVKLATAPNTDGSVQVGIFEEMSGGTGPSWRAGVWVSAFRRGDDARPRI